MYAQPLVAFTNTNVKAAPFVDTTKLEAAPKILEPFLAMVRLFDAKLAPLSIKVTSDPTLGDAGKVIVIADPIPLPDVSINN